MKIEIDLTPSDLSKIIIDLKFKRVCSTFLLQQIVEKVRNEIEINTDEIEQLQTIINEGSDEKIEKEGAIF